MAKFRNAFHTFLGGIIASLLFGIIAAVPSAAVSVAIEMIVQYYPAAAPYFQSTLYLCLLNLLVTSLCYWLSSFVTDRFLIRYFRKWSKDSENAVRIFLLFRVCLGALGVFADNPEAPALAFCIALGSLLPSFAILRCKKDHPVTLPSVDPPLEVPSESTDQPNPPSRQRISLHNRLAEWFSTVFGVAGSLFLWLLLSAFYFAPLFVLPIPFWISVLIIVLLLNVGQLAVVLSLPLWIWAFVQVINHPLDAVSWIFLGCFAVYAFCFIHDVFLFVRLGFAYRSKAEPQKRKKKRSKRSFRIKRIRWIVSGLVVGFIIGFQANELLSILPASLSSPSTAQLSVTLAPSPAPTRAPIPGAIPYNGKVFRYSGIYCLDSSNLANLTIETPYGQDYYCVVLVDSEDPSKKYCSVFVHAGKTVTVNVPNREMLIYFTTAPKSSAVWYNADYFFGETGRWSTSDDTFDFKDYDWTITLDKIVDGNWDTDPVDASKVPFLD